MTESPIKIIPADVPDAEKILTLQKTAYLMEAEIYGQYDIPPLTQTLADLVSTFQDEFFLKAVIGERVVGSVRARRTGDTCHIGRLIVHPSYQRLGIGSDLMAEIEARFAEAKRYEIFVGEKSAGNLKLFKGLGYSEFKRIPLDSNFTLVFLEKISERK